jgi:PAS domain S-box-containing protein
MMFPPSVPPSNSNPGSEWLRDSKEHFDQLIAAVDDCAIFRLGLDGTVMDWNSGAFRLKGYTAAEIVGENVARFYAAEDLQRGLPELELSTALQTGKFSDEGWRYRKDGSRFWAAVTIKAIHDATGSVVGFLKIIRDLTDRKQVENAARDSEARLRLLIESVQDYAIFLLDPEGHIVSWNSGARRIKQYEEWEIVGAHFSLFYPPEALAIGLPATLLREALREGRAEDEGWRVRKDGTRFWGNVIITALYNDQQELRGFAKITRDLTGQRQIESLRESGKRKDAFLATLAHELRNPLAPILTAVEMLQRRPEDQAMVLKLSGILQTQVGQMTHLIDDLLDMARITSGKIVLQKSIVLLSEIVETAVQTVQPALSERHHEFRCTLPPEPVAMEVDPHRLVQILANLLSNAAKYTPVHGLIQLQASVREGGEVEIVVKDNGNGIPAVLQRSIFELFDQGVGGSPDGLGIGLTLVKTLTELHGGAISVFSQGEGRGSEFTLKIPLPQRVEAESAGAGQVGLPALDSKRILVADDSRNAADTLAMFLRQEGFDVVVAYDGDEAVAVAKQFAPKLAFLDLGMPKRDGMEAARVIRRAFPGIILAALSGWGAESDRLRTAEAGFDLHLVKPSSPEELRRVLGLLAPRQVPF